MANPFSLQDYLGDITRFQNLEMLANQIVEGFISGMHKSPFHGFSAEFSEHKLYNKGESTRHIDWKLFAKTDRLYTKIYEEETNLRCHILLDNSSSMHYPKLQDVSNAYHTKIGFSALAAACLMNVLKKQRDAVGMSVYSDAYEYYAPEKGSERHFRMLYAQLETVVNQVGEQKRTHQDTYLHQIAEKLHRRSMVIWFTDWLIGRDLESLHKILQHLKHQKHRVIVFHVLDSAKERQFDFDDAPRRWIDVETGEMLEVYTDQVRKSYTEAMKTHVDGLRMACLQNKISYVSVDVNQDFEKIMTTFFTERQMFMR
jgi:uncharacterized protein (DUF58 family)